MYILECIFQWADRKFSFRIFFPMTFVLCHFMIWALMNAYSNFDVCNKNPRGIKIDEIFKPKELNFNTL